MYEIHNKLRINVNAKGDELKKIFEENNLHYSYDRVDDEMRDIPDEPLLRRRLKAATCFTWVGSIKPGEDLLDPTDYKDALNVADVEDMAKIYEANGIGFAYLEPNKSVTIKKIDRFLDELINSSFADKITITDTDTGEMIWDGAVKKVEYQLARTSKEREDDKFKTYKGEVIYNKLDPEQGPDKPYDPRDFKRQVYRAPKTEAKK
jgi:hypothetical protein